METDYHILLTENIVSAEGGRKMIHAVGERALPGLLALPDHVSSTHQLSRIGIITPSRSGG